MVILLAALSNSAAVMRYVIAPTRKFTHPDSLDKTQQDISIGFMNTAFIHFEAWEQSSSHWL